MGSTPFLSSKSGAAAKLCCVRRFTGSSCHLLRLAACPFGTVYAAIRSGVIFLQDDLMSMAPGISDSVFSFQFRNPVEGLVVVWKFICLPLGS